MAKRKTSGNAPRGRWTPGTGGRAPKAPAATYLTQRAPCEFGASAEIREGPLPAALAYVHERDDARTPIAAATGAKDINGDSPGLNGDLCSALLSSPVLSAVARPVVVCSPAPSISCNPVRRR